MDTPKESHWIVAKGILRYIKGTLDFCLFYFLLMMMRHYMAIWIVIREITKMKGKALLVMFSILN